MKRATWLCWLGLCLSAMSSCAAEVADPIEDLEAEVGGPDGVADMFRSQTEAEVRAQLADYGIGYVVSALSIETCPKFFEATYRNTWHNISGEFYYVDGSGRPSRAYKDVPPVAAESRSESCQGNVGGWGDVENPANDYDGGHLIGSQLGGWGKRANLVPQDTNFNRGNWAVLENKVALCRTLPSLRMHYYVSAGYPNTSALIPNTMGMQITNNASSANVSLSFSNVDYGGTSGTSEKNRGVAFLSGQGCN